MSADGNLSLQSGRKKIYHKHMHTQWIWVVVGRREGICNIHTCSYRGMVSVDYIMENKEKVSLTFHKCDLYALV